MNMHRSQSTRQKENGKIPHENQEEEMIDCWNPEEGINS